MMNIQMHILLGVDNQKMRILKRVILMLLLSDSCCTSKSRH